MITSCVTELDPATSPRWATFVERRESDLFHSPAWLRALASTFGLEFRARVTADETGELENGLVYSRIDDDCGDRRVSLPFSDYCDPLVDGEAGWRAVSSELLRSDVPFRLRASRCSYPGRDESLLETDFAFRHTVELDAPLEDIWAGLGASARRAVRRARKAEVVVRPATGRSELRAFYDMHLAVRRDKYRLLAQPFALFESLWEEFIERDRGVLNLARHRDEIVGGVFFLEWRDTLYYKFNASRAGRLDVRPNDLATWTGIEYAHERDLRHLDFGVSDHDQPGLVAYKRKFATREERVRFLSNRAAVPSRTGLASHLGELTRLLTEPGVPASVTERGGELLYRFFA